jgi:hypothetical protein
LVFPASSVAFDRRRSGLRGIPGARAASPTEAGCRGSPRGLHSPPERSSAAGRLSPPILSWDSSGCALLPAGQSRVHSREPKPPSVRRVPPVESRSVLVVPPHLDGFLRAEVAGLLHPAAGQGFVAFRVHRRPNTRRPSEDGPECGTLTVALPATRFTPFEVFPSPTAAPRHRGRCHPCRYRPTEAGRRFDSMKLRSAEADPHVTEGSAGVGPPRTPCIPTAATSREHRRARVDPSNHREQLGFEALLRRRSSLSSKPPLPMTDVRSFHGLCSPSRSTVVP